MGLQVGTLIRNSSILVDLYLSLDAQKDDFFMNIISATAYSLKLEQMDLASPSRETSTLWVLATTPFTLTFIPFSNIIVVPEAVLQSEALLQDESQM
jgi:hypothetical protein